MDFYLRYWINTAKETYYFGIIFLPKLHEDENKWTGGGRLHSSHLSPRAAIE